eukprot:Pgem_evm1s4462
MAPVTNQNEIFSCEVCDKHFNLARKLKCHRSSSILCFPNRSFYCKLCDTELNKFNFKSHKCDGSGETVPQKKKRKPRKISGGGGKGSKKITDFFKNVFYKASGSYPEPDLETLLKQETIDLKQDDLNSETLDLNSETLDLNSETLDLNSETLDLNSETLDLKHQILN